MSKIYDTNTLYSMDALGNIRSWKATVKSLNDGTAIVELDLGVNNNIRSTKRILSKGKNTSKSNATSPYSQAVKEVIAKYDKKLKQGYKLNTENLTISKADINNILKPMKAVQFRRGLMNYPAILQVKINGLRCSSSNVSNKTFETVLPLFSTNTTDTIKLLTKEGLEYILPTISMELKSVLSQYSDINIDGELYMHNEILSNIRRRIPYIKSNGTLIHHSLSSDPIVLMCFDLNIKDYPQTLRLEMKDMILNRSNCNSLYYNKNTNRFEFDIINSSRLINVKHVIVGSDEEVYNYLEIAIASGFEGVIIRDFDAEYMFGGRRTNMSKLKKAKSSEFELLDIILKNTDSNRTYIALVLKNNVNDLVFECTPEGNESDRLNMLTNKEMYIGKLVTVTYYERTINKLPFHAVGRIRDSFDLDVNDLIIEE